MPSYKLYYFPGRGRAELSRFVFAQAGVQYEDERVQGEEWGKLKPGELARSSTVEDAHKRAASCSMHCLLLFFRFALGCDALP